jgi:excisionase family DNA binding protein
MPARKKATAKKTAAKRTIKRPERPKPQTEEIDPARRERIDGLKQELLGDFLTAAEVAEILEVHPRTVGEYIRDGKLHAIQLGGGWRISEESLRSFVKSVAELPQAASRDGGLFSRFTDRARKVVTLAQEEARQINHNYIGTEHLLLGLLAEGKGVGALALKALGISLEEIRKDVVSKIGTGSSTPRGPIPFTPRAKKTLELSLREALLLGHNYIGTEHIILALLKEGSGVASQVLQARDVKDEALRDEVLKLLSGYAPAQKPMLKIHRKKK